MPKTYQFGDLQFEANLIYALTAHQTKIKFSKHERALLHCFIRRPGELLRRNVLLDAVQSENLETFDRNIDYLLSRLRRKLGDSPKAPRYIATQYGEGYIWVAKEAHQAPAKAQALYLSVGPFYGLSQQHKDHAGAQGFIQAFVPALESVFGDHRPIAIAPEDNQQATADDILWHYDANFALEASFLPDSESLICVLVALNRKTGQVFGTFRFDFSQETQTQSLDQAMAQLAKNIRGEIWDTQIFRAGDAPSLSDAPLAVSIYEATLLFEPNIEHFDRVEQKIRGKLLKNPDNHRAAILLAVSLRNRTYAGQVQGIESRELEIENLILEHLGGIQHDALYLSAAAEMLFEQGHGELAQNLAERALDIGSSLAACSMVVGRLKILQGQFDEGIAYYDHSLQMSEPDTPFYKMLQTRKCIAYKAAGKQEKVREITAYLVKQAHEPGKLIADTLKKIGLQIYFLADDPEAFGIKNRALSALIPQKRAHHAFLIMHYVTSRFFTDVAHRENLLRGLTHLFYQRHGDTVIPEEVRQSVPRLFL
mgnify:CR=1 FL=1